MFIDNLGLRNFFGQPEGHITVVFRRGGDLVQQGLLGFQAQGGPDLCLNSR